MQALSASNFGSTSANANVAVGYRALRCNLNGDRNTALGTRALELNTTGVANTAIGSFSLVANTTGANNTAIGNNSGCLITTGANNVILGSFTGTGFTTSNCNIFLSDGAGNVRMYITGTTGNVNINTTVDQGYKLGVVGSIGTTGTITADSNIRSFGQIASDVTDRGSSGSGSTITWDWNEGNIQKILMTGNCLFIFTNPLAGASYQIIITQDGTGGRTITWPTIHWEGKTVPSLTGTANSVDVVTLTYDGVKYLGVMSKNHGV